MPRGRKKTLDTAEVVEDVWAQCEACEKWRKLPPGTFVDEEKSWFCKFNPDPRYNTCQAPEEPWQATAELDGAGSGADASKQQQKKQVTEEPKKRKGSLGVGTADSGDVQPAKKRKQSAGGASNGAAAVGLTPAAAAGTALTPAAAALDSGPPAKYFKSARDEVQEIIRGCNRLVANYGTWEPCDTSQQLGPHHLHLPHWFWAGLRQLAPVATDAAIAACEAYSACCAATAHTSADDDDSEDAAAAGTGNGGAGQGPGPGPGSSLVKQLEPYARLAYLTAACATLPLAEQALNNLNAKSKGRTQLLAIDELPGAKTTPAGGSAHASAGATGAGGSGARKSVLLPPPHQQQQQQQWQPAQASAHVGGAGAAPGLDRRQQQQQGLPGQMHSSARQFPTPHIPNQSSLSLQQQQRQQAAFLASQSQQQPHQSQHHPVSLMQHAPQARLPPQQQLQAQGITPDMLANLAAERGTSVQAVMAQLLAGSYASQAAGLSTGLGLPHQVMAGGGTGSGGGPGGGPGGGRADQLLLHAHAAGNHAAYQSSMPGPQSLGMPSGLQQQLPGQLGGASGPNAGALMQAMAAAAATRPAGGTSVGGPSPTAQALAEMLRAQPQLLSAFPASLANASANPNANMVGRDNINALLMQQQAWPPR